MSETVALSPLILDIGNKIDTMIDANTNGAQKWTRPTDEWIPQNKMSQTKGIQLRTAEDTKSENGVKLRRFNPSFFLKDSSTIHCRIPGCSTTVQRLKPANSGENIKQDLFLCSSHREMLISEITKRCAEENVFVPSFGQEDFIGYTSLIGKLEKAFTHFQKQASSPSDTNSLLAEVFLNTRNFLIITNALLNPDEDNIKTTMPSCMTMLNNVLSSTKNQSLLQKMIVLMRNVQNTILFYFSIFYAWVELTSPGTRLGGGVGLALGFFGCALGGFASGVIAAGSVVGLIAGSLIGSGGYDMRSDPAEVKARQEAMQRYLQFLSQTFGAAPQKAQCFHMSANADGDLTVIVADLTYQ